MKYKDLTTSILVVACLVLYSLCHHGGAHPIDNMKGAESAGNTALTVNSADTDATEEKHVVVEKIVNGVLTKFKNIADKDVDANKNYIADSKTSQISNVYVKDAPKKSQLITSSPMLKQLMSHSEAEQPEINFAVRDFSDGPVYDSMGEKEISSGTPSKMSDVLSEKVGQAIISEPPAPVKNAKPVGQVQLDHPAELVNDQDPFNVVEDDEIDDEDGG